MYYSEIIGPRESKVVKKFAIFPEEIRGKLVWLKSYFETQEKVIEVHDGCADCFNPFGGVPCEENRSYWKVVSKSLRRENGGI